MFPDKYLIYLSNLTKKHLLYLAHDVFFINAEFAIASNISIFNRRSNLFTTMKNFSFERQFVLYFAHIFILFL
ncbi:hypothetical protein GDO81_000143 [Engystomops pustulosus]|uniref:Uncharacterized protein n=1 Tax=Engystomops pustulosus TaxID=76066 RepID=A0AAV7D1R0_ENGPU|nr:hypothetical protein GDO81_000143 [Engystomops pustulosus]